MIFRDQGSIRAYRDAPSTSMESWAEEYGKYCRIQLQKQLISIEKMAQKVTKKIYLNLKIISGIVRQIPLWEERKMGEEA